MKGKNRSSRWSGGSTGRAKPHSGGRSHGSPSRGGSHRGEAPRQREHARNPAPAPLKTHVPARSKSGIWLYGIHPVLAAAANPRRRTIRVLVTPEHEATLGARIAVLAQSHPLGLPAA